MKIILEKLDNEDSEGYSTIEMDDDRFNVPGWISLRITNEFNKTMSVDVHISNLSSAIKGFEDKYNKEKSC